MATNFEKLQKLLEELFQLDQADLDFGIYRIMNQKRDEVVRFLEKDLLPQVKEAFSHYKSADKATLQKELDKAIEQANGLGVDPETTTKVKELREQMADSSVDVTALENEVFSHLFNFFRRYYHEGDFISLRRYKEGVYAIPYEGEEVKLHWANHDQYYVKSSEYFRDYIFTMPSGKRVRVHLVAASSEQDNKKEQAGKERRFVICEEDPIYEENGELFIRFEYKSDNGKKKQDALNQEAIERVLKSEGFEEWTRELSKPAPTKSNPKRTVLEKHLTQYTARNTFDYFIHKDLGGFLRRELDFYIKNEVMHLDDIEHDTVPRVEQYLSKIKVIRKIAHKIIQFLEQLENFQKKLWLKKKFVVETNYCITLDRVPEKLYPEIAANDAQREEWVRLFAIDKIEKDLNGPGYSEPLSVEFLKGYPTLSVDTRYFDEQFKRRILQETSDLEETLRGTVVCSENFQALALMKSRFRGRVKCTYIDPPYNTDASAINYKNGYKSSSWVALMQDRLQASAPLLTDDGVLVGAIDDEQQRELNFLLENNFSGGLLGTFCVRSNPSGRPTKAGYSVSHEYLLFAGNTFEASISRMPPTDDQMARFNQTDEDGVFEWRNLRREGSNSDRDARRALYYPIYVTENSIRVPKMEWNPKAEEWLVKEESLPNETVAWPTNDDGDEKTWRWEWATVMKSLDQLAVRKDRSGRDYVYYKRRPNENGVVSVSSWFDPKYSATEHGTAVIKALFGDNVFSYPKSIHAVVDAIYIAGASKNDVCVLDYFAGSGTTGHAVVRLNQQDGGHRKFVLVEVGTHVDAVLIPRLKKVVFTPEWSDGQPSRLATEAEAASVSGIIKYIRLESYEDALNNLEMKRSDQQASLLDQDDDLREQYVLSYMLDVESRGSQSLLNVESFRNPDEYKLRVEHNGETQLVNVDLVETFNWLLGLTVKHIDVIRGVRVVEGTNPDGDRALVLWRNLDEIDNDALDEWFKKQDYNTKDQEYDLIYVNGDNNLENLRRGDQTWKVRLTEEEFGRLMFNVEDV
ncbi:MAG: site-specific DNA-methyltransferase [Planctomycetaceae bacterium]|nr:site-specific DNA-methyltransferase [Planctomycetaceae bacterium]